MAEHSASLPIGLVRFGKEAMTTAAECAGADESVTIPELIETFATSNETASEKNEADWTEPARVRART